MKTISQLEKNDHPQDLRAASRGIGWNQKGSSAPSALWNSVTLTRMLHILKILFPFSMLIKSRLIQSSYPTSVHIQKGNSLLSFPSKGLDVIVFVGLERAQTILHSCVNFSKAKPTLTPFREAWHIYSWAFMKPLANGCRESRLVGWRVEGWEKSG